MWSPSGTQDTLFNFEVTPQQTGANGDEVTPVPIPNTEVKLISVENTWLETAREDRAAPALFYGPLAQLVRATGS